MNSPTAQLEVFFDGRCPLCSREIAHYRRLDRGEAIRFTDLWLEPGRVADAGISHGQAMAELHARQGDGPLLRGVPVFFAIWRRLPRWRWLARLLAPLEHSRWLGAAYAAFARRRLARRCEAGVCGTAPGE